MSFLHLHELFYSKGGTIFHREEFYSQALKIIWTKKTNFVTKKYERTNQTQAKDFFGIYSLQ